MQKDTNVKALQLAAGLLIGIQGICSGSQNHHAIRLRRCCLHGSLHLGKERGDLSRVHDHARPTGYGEGSIRLRNRPFGHEDLKEARRGLGGEEAEDGVKRQICPLPVAGQQAGGAYALQQEGGYAECDCELASICDYGVGREVVLGEGAREAPQALGVELFQLGQARQAAICHELNGGTVRRLRHIRLVLLHKPLPQLEALMIALAVLVEAEEVHECIRVRLEFVLAEVVDELLHEREQVGRLLAVAVAVAGARVQDLG